MGRTTAMIYIGLKEPGLEGRMQHSENGRCGLFLPQTGFVCASHGFETLNFDTPSMITTPPHPVLCSTTLAPLAPDSLPFQRRIDFITVHQNHQAILTKFFARLTSSPPPSPKSLTRSPSHSRHHHFDLANIQRHSLGKGVLLSW